MKLTTTLLITALLSILTGCAGVKSVKVERQQLFIDKVTGKVQPTLFWSHYDATQRGSLFKMDDQGRLTVLSENPPDAAVENSLNIVAKAQDGKGVSAEATMEAVRSIAQLGQRTAAVNILRDALYRLAEMCNNSAAGMGATMSPDVKEVMLRTLETCERVSIELAKETDATKQAEKVRDLKEMFMALPEEQRQALDLNMMLQQL